MYKIAFSGKAYSGKSSYAHYLRDIYGFEVLSFATILKETVTEVFGMKEKDRDLLQKVGAALREIDSNVFVNYLERQIQSIPNNLCAGLTVDDLRYPNEADMLKRNGFILVRLIVVPEVLEERASKLNVEMTEEQKSHHSECALDDYDGFNYFMTSNGPLTTEYTKIDDFYNYLRKK